MATVPKVDVGTDYKEKYGFFVPEDFVFKAKRGLNPEIVKEISGMKKEPEWMLKMRLRSLEIFRKKTMPTWGADLSVIDFENIFYYLKASDKQSTSWEDLPPDIKKTYDRLGVPEAERKFLAGVSAQYESEVVYHSLQKELTAKGVIFTDTDSALRGSRDHRQEERALPLYDDPELVDQRLQPGHQASDGIRRRDDGMGRRQPGLADHDEIPLRLSDGARRKGRRVVGRVRRQGPAPGRRRQDDPRGAEHDVDHHFEVNLQGRWAHFVPRPHQDLSGRDQLQVVRQVRRAVAGR